MENIEEDGTGKAVPVANKLAFVLEKFKHQDPIVVHLLNFTKRIQQGLVPGI